MNKSLSEQIIESDLKERIKVVKKNKLENYSSIEKQLKDIGFIETGTFSFEDPKLKIIHNKSIYVLTDSGLIVTLYFISTKKDVKVPMQLTVCGQHRNGDYIRISCDGQKDNLMNDFIDNKITILKKESNAVWTTIDSHFTLLDEYDDLFISRQINNYDEFKKYFINQFDFYGTVYDNSNTYNTILNQVQCAELNKNIKNIRTNLYVVTSDKITKLMGINLTKIKINRAKNLYTGLVLSMKNYTTLDNVIDEKFNDKNLFVSCLSLEEPEKEFNS